MSLNKLMIIGNLGKDPESMISQSGMHITKFSVATSSKYTDKQGQKVEETEWHRITAFGKLGEICSQYLTKGSKVYVEGRLKTSEYEKDGVKRFSTDVIANDMRMLDSKGQGEASAPAFTGQQVGSPAPRPAQPPLPALDKDFDSEIPF